MVSEARFLDTETSDHFCLPGNAEKLKRCVEKLSPILANTMEANASHNPGSNQRTASHVEMDIDILVKVGREIKL